MIPEPADLAVPDHIAAAASCATVRGGSHLGILACLLANACLWSFVDLAIMPRQLRNLHKSLSLLARRATLRAARPRAWGRPRAYSGLGTVYAGLSDEEVEVRVPDQAS